MSNSPLVQYTKISPNKNSPRKHKIDTITIHCVVGQCSAETIGNVFAPTSRRASSNYGIGYDGKIGMYVEEKDRSWCSSSGANDHRAITIEVASDRTPPYAVNDAAYKSLIKLLVDICQRNGIPELKWKGDKSLIGQVDKQNMTVHRWFTNLKSCPGDYLYERHGQIAAEVNAILKGNKPEPPKPQPNDKISKGDLVKIAAGATYYSGKKVPSWVAKTNWFVHEVNGNRVVINKSENGKYAIMSAIDAKYLTVVGDKPQPPKPKPEPSKHYDVRVTAGALNVRKGPGLNYGISTVVHKNERYTIVEEKSDGARPWGKLVSGAGWISLKYTEKVNVPQYETYVVQENDNLWDISADKLGDGRRYTEIKELNGLKSDTLRIGQVLKIPKK